MLLPPYGTYWLITVLEEYDSVNCLSADRYCLQDSWASSAQRTFGIVGTVALSVQKSGSGTVTSSPAGINCGSTCSASFTQGTVVSLFAAPSSGYTFTGWSGGGCAGTGSCLVVLNAATTVNASFVPSTPQLVNISTRGLVLTGDNVMIGGFIIDGAAPKTVLIRARGPSMIPAGVTNALSDTIVTLVNQTGQVIASNDDWTTNANANAIFATGLAPTNSLESAILITLSPGAYTAIVSGYQGATGVGIVEVFAQ
jgi:hypothetical protein